MTTVRVRVAAAALNVQFLKLLLQRWMKLFDGRRRWLDILLFSSSARRLCSFLLSPRVHDAGAIIVFFPVCVMMVRLLNLNFNPQFLISVVAAILIERFEHRGPNCLLLSQGGLLGFLSGSFISASCDVSIHSLGRRPECFISRSF